jgi:DNA polymerase-4
VATAVQERIMAELGLGCSVGVGTSKLVAKLASKAAKPRATLRGLEPGAGVVVVPPDAELPFLHRLPVSALWGVGPATRERLGRLGVASVGDLAALPLATLEGCVGRAAGRHLHDLAWGRDPRPVEPARGVKSVGHEETYATDLVDGAQLRREAVRMADAVAARLRHGSLAGRTVTVKVRFHDFSTITRSSTLDAAVETGPELARVAISLLDQVDPTAGVRLVGVSVSNLAAGAARQLTLEEAAAPPWRQASHAVDRIRGRFGPAAVGPAALIGEDGLEVRRRGDQQWGPRGRRDR